MFFQTQTNTGFRIGLILMLIVGIFGVLPARASAETSTVPITEGNFSDSSSTLSNDCSPNDGWMWTNGPLQPAVAVQVQEKLSQQGIESIVEARSYGETDSCGTYSHRGIDFTITLVDSPSNNQLSQQTLADKIFPVLVEFGKPELGNVKVFSPQDDLLPINKSPMFFNDGFPNTESLRAGLLPADAITKNVYVIVYDPLLSNGQKLSQYMGWYDHATITQQTVDFFKQASNDRMNYVVTNTTIVTSGWPELVDGFRYTESEYLAVIANPNLHHSPTAVNYNKIVNAPEFDICGKVNRGEIDEVWIYNGPWFGFSESTLVGPDAYMYNSGPVPGPHNCNRLIPIMGPSVERAADMAVHNFGHRMEATMVKVYGGWQQNNTSHNWNKFGLVKVQSPNYPYSGCGSIHFPPNGTFGEGDGYDYSNLSNNVLSNCSDFANYPNLSDPLQVAQPVNCSAWGCNHLGYLQYWFGYLPSFSGCSSDNTTNDWWLYFADPANALSPSSFCPSNVNWISGNATVAGVTLSYTDGSPKTTMTDSFGDYSLVVSNNWSGTVTPSRLGHTFSPVSRSYTNVVANHVNQDYSSPTGAPTPYYVNIVTGNNSNSCKAVAAPCRNIQEAINKANVGSTIYVTSGTYLFSTNPSPNVVIINNDIKLSGGWNFDFTSQNGASTIDGANVNNGILLVGGNVFVENFIVQNSRSSNSGAIYIVNGSFTLRKSTLRNNVADSNGAGIFMDNGTLTVINSTISGNTAGSSGGGIYASNNSSASVTIQNSTIAYNQASTGGGISRPNGTYNITNTIIANNAATFSPDCNGTIAMANFSIIENTAGCSITSGVNNLNVDPQIDSNLIGVMPVHALLTGSPAINAGTNTGCPFTDQIGTSRPQGTACDIGAYEYPAPPTVTTQAVTAIGTTTATGNGNITSLGAPNPTQYGVVWSTVINPTVALATKTAQGIPAGTGAFTSNITGLTAGTLYHVRAYATNSTGTAYGADVTFTTQTTVIFNANGGAGSMSNQSANTATALTTNGFTRTGYTFSGWNTSANGTGTAYANGAVYPFTAHVTLYAQWTVNQYTITFNSNGGSAVTAITQDYGTAVSAPTNPTKTGNTFGGWYSDAGLTMAYTFTTMPAANITLYAKWTISQYTIMFNSNGGSAVTTITQDYGTAVSAPTNPTKTGNNFGGWYSDVGLTTAYTFTTMPAANITLYAKWTINQYTITFNSNGGSAVTAITQNYGSAVSVPTNPTKTGNTFGGWYSDAGLTMAYTFTTMPAANITLYAKWTINTYTATFNANGGTGSMSNQTQNYNVATALTLNAFTRAGYTFTGWNTAANGSGTAYANGATYPFTADVTLYAQWLTGFNTIGKWSSSFDLSHGWTVAEYVRTVGDVNNDGRADLIGFGLDGVYVALSNGTSFDAISKWTSAFDLSHGWTVASYVRTVGDVNNDGRVDLIGFGQDGVYVALSNSTSFGAISKWTSAFDLSHGWTVASYLRTVGDVTGDGKVDLVGFGLDGVYIATAK